MNSPQLYLVLKLTIETRCDLEADKQQCELRTSQPIKRTVKCIHKANEFCYVPKVYSAVTLYNKIIINWAKLVST